MLGMYFALRLFGVRPTSLRRLQTGGRQNTCIASLTVAASKALLPSVDQFMSFSVTSINSVVWAWKSINLFLDGYSLVDRPQSWSQADVVGRCRQNSIASMTTAFCARGTLTLTLWMH